MNRKKQQLINRRENTKHPSCWKMFLAKDDNKQLTVHPTVSQRVKESCLGSCGML